MKIEILGCSGSVAKGFNTTSILINETLLIDAGSAASMLEPERFARIDDVIITHAHLDHIKELPFIADIAFTKKGKGITVWASPVTIRILREHVFNGLVWLDARELVINGKPLIRFEEINAEIALQTVHVTPVSADHMPGALGLLVNENDAYVLVSGDTGYAKELGEVVASLGDKLKVFFVEASFPDRMQDVAIKAKHLTPGMIRDLLRGSVSPHAQIIFYHIKPDFLDEIVRDLPPGIGYIKGGEVFEF